MITSSALTTVSATIWAVASSAGNTIIFSNPNNVVGYARVSSLAVRTNTLHRTSTPATEGRKGRVRALEYPDRPTEGRPPHRSNSAQWLRLREGFIAWGW